jgi:hypothetical protein
MAGSYEVLYNTLRVIENDIAVTQRLKDAEREQLLMACAVARYSSKFWHDLSTGATSYPGVHTVSSTTGGDIARADVKGAVTGAITGGVLGAGALPGCVVGGAASSIAEGVAKIWDWLF